ncbi:MAG: sigma-70 family RNA polymerase sigma factor, partial [Candidatus Hydrogenedentes bacterium]|nr:sigma-70 family RNA polymerase sigma factor [Candidatus Hydrogenedentota bacterium]
MSLPLEACLVYDVWLVSDNAKTRNELLRDQPDPALVAKAQTGELEAFEELVRRYRNDVFRLAYHYLHNREEAWDLSQEVFIKVYRSVGHFRGESNFKTWLLRIAANQCKDYFKKRRLATVSFDARIGVEPPGNQLEPGRAVAAQEIGEAIQAALEKL